MDYEDMISNNERLSDLWHQIHDTALPILCALINRDDRTAEVTQQHIKDAANLALDLQRETMRSVVERFQALTTDEFC